MLSVVMPDPSETLDFLLPLVPEASFFSKLLSGFSEALLGLLITRGSPLQKVLCIQDYRFSALMYEPRSQSTYFDV